MSLTRFWLEMRAGLSGEQVNGHDVAGGCGDAVA